MLFFTLYNTINSFRLTILLAKVKAVFSSSTTLTKDNDQSTAYNEVPPALLMVDSFSHQHLHFTAASTFITVVSNPFNLCDLKSF